MQCSGCKTNGASQTDTAILAALQQESKQRAVEREQAGVIRTWHCVTGQRGELQLELHGRTAARIISTVQQCKWVVRIIW